MGIVLFQTVVNWPFLVVGVVLLAAFRKESVQAYWLAFFTGLLGDLVFGRTIGTTAIFLLLAAVSVHLLKMRTKLNVLGLLLLVVTWGILAEFIIGSQ